MCDHTACKYVCVYIYIYIYICAYESIYVYECRDEMMAMTRSLEPHTATINYKTMYDELKVDKEREKATVSI